MKTTAWILSIAASLGERFDAARFVGRTTGVTEAGR